MVRAIFIDWFNTLARYEPPRHELYRQVFSEFGIELPVKEIMRGVLAGDKYYFEENAKSPVSQRSPEGQFQVYSYYPKAILAQAGVSFADDLPLKVIRKVAQEFKGAYFVLFDDVLPALKALKQREFIMGLLTNATKEVVPVLEKTGAMSYLDFVVVSDEVGANKPAPPIFLAALERAGVPASEAVHVGDQYDLDVVGARGVGISPILIDRYGLYPEMGDCPRITSLSELVSYL